MAGNMNKDEKTGTVVSVCKKKAIRSQSIAVYSHKKYRTSLADAMRLDDK